MAAPLQVAETAPEGSVLAVLPDTGERYFSTPLFEGVNEGSDDDWMASPGWANCARRSIFRPVPSI